MMLGREPPTHDEQEPGAGETAGEPHGESGGVRYQAYRAGRPMATRPAWRRRESNSGGQPTINVIYVAKRTRIEALPLD